MKKVKVSVIMAIFNTPFEMFQRAIDSVLNQDFDNFEIIVVNDGSDLVLSRQLFDYCMTYEDKICFIHCKNVGQSFAVNRAVHFAKGDFITIIDADDEYKTNHLSSCLHEMDNADLISSLTETIVAKDDDYYVVDKHDLHKNIHVDDCTLFGTLFGKSEVFKNISFENGYAADSFFYDEAQKTYKVKKSTSRTYVYYRNIESSISALQKQKRLQEVL
jgi:glycosyltransferase involved in cell wall biosynthesis